MSNNNLFKGMNIDKRGWGIPKLRDFVSKVCDNFEEKKMVYIF